MTRKKKIEGTLLTSAMLKRAGACSGVRLYYRKKYPKGFRVTATSCARIANLVGARWYWAANHLLTAEGYNKWFAAVDAYANSYTSFKVDYVVRATLFGALYNTDEYRKRV